MEFRTLQKSEFISCQPDCSFLDNKFHEECVGFNGCKDNIFLRDKNYCEDDSDCTYFFGCCASECVGSECFNAKFCPVTNKIFSKAQKLSCENIDCVKKSSCKVSKRIVCVNNACLI
ncbi:MAG: hypothetical protein ABIC91_01540 [Nanoarchaeota archaeon]|nr:hypothetical protein [Nanoarchaeota archaeon]